MTAAPAKSQSTPSLPRLFRDGTFELGEPRLYRVVTQDFPTEYSAGEYLAIATLGQPIAVGSVQLSVASRVKLPHRKEPVEAWSCYELDLAIIPGRGVWQLEPVFESWDGPIRRAARARAALGELLELDPRVLPLSMAYVPVLGREIAPGRPDDVRHEDVYSPTLFLDPITALRPSATPEEVDALVADILEVGDWVDTKACDRIGLVDSIPAWLSSLIPGYDGFD